MSKENNEFDIRIPLSFMVHYKVILLSSPNEFKGIKGIITTIPSYEVDSLVQGVDKEGKYRILKVLDKNLKKISEMLNLKEHLFEFNDPRLSPVKLHLSLFSKIIKAEDEDLDEIIDRLKVFKKGAKPDENLSPFAECSPKMENKIDIFPKVFYYITNV